MRYLALALAATLLVPACGGGGGGNGHSGRERPLDLLFDFQPANGVTLSGATPVTPGDLYTADRGHGFLVAPRSTFNGRRFAFNLYGKSITVQEAVPLSVQSAATLDGVTSSRAYTFRADVPKGQYDVTLWMGDVTTPTYQVRALVNKEPVDATRMDVNHLRGRFDGSIFGNVVPRRIRVKAPQGAIEIEMGPHPDGADPVEWTYTQDEDPNDPRQVKTVVLVPAYTAAALAAVEIHTAMEISSDPADPALRALELFREAGDPATLDREPELLAQAEALLESALAADPEDFAARDLLGEVRRMADAERYRRLYGYAASNSSAAENMGRSSALVEELPPDHPYATKGEILWIRNRGGLDPRRVTASWELAQKKARELDPAWGAVNPYVHLYATDDWTPDGERWTVIDWAAVAGDGPDWARNLMSNLNAWLDLFEWWCIHRQAPEGDIGGGWTDDVEIVPAFGLMAYVLEGASVIAEDAVLAFADGIWRSDVVDEARGYQRQYADVEHTAEPTGNILHLPPLVRYGDPEGIERMLVSGKTFSEFFLTDGTASPYGHRHFRGNHLSATAIATNPDHRADIPLCGRVTAPLVFLDWYAGNPGIRDPLEAWAKAWAEDALRTDHGKPAGVFPQLVWVPDDGIGFAGNWWAKDSAHGQFGEFPKYQFYLYSLLGYLWLQTGDPDFRAPFDALRDLTLAWDAAGRPATGTAPAPGSEALWCGEHLGSIGAGATLNMKLGSGRTDWDAYLATFGGSYARFLLDPTDEAPIDDLKPYVDALYERWPYRTTEGLMTDRILVPGWAEVISYYLGAEVFSVFFGMPVHAVTWTDTTRLFAAAVTEASADRIGATLFLFTDEDREVGVRLWRLTPGADYVLSRGPAAGLGLDPSSVEETVPFTYRERGQEVRFTLPGRTTTAIRIRKVADPAAPPPAARPDLAIAPRDALWNAGRKELSMTVHNVGAAPAPATTLHVTWGGGTISVPVPALEAPLDLVPRRIVATVSLPGEPEVVALSIDPVPGEITARNNVTTAWLSGGSPERPAPMIVTLSATEGSSGDVIEIAGKNFDPSISLLRSGVPATGFALVFVDAGHVRVTITTAPPGPHLLSLADPGGKTSNLVPITVR